MKRAIKVVVFIVLGGTGVCLLHFAQNRARPKIWLWVAGAELFWFLIVPGLLGWLYQGRIYRLERSAKKHKRDELIARNICLSCGYDLRSNVSGICRECGSLAEGPGERPGGTPC